MTCKTITTSPALVKEGIGCGSQVGSCPRLSVAPLRPSKPAARLFPACTRSEQCGRNGLHDLSALQKLAQAERTTFNELNTIHEHSNTFKKHHGALTRSGKTGIPPGRAYEGQRQPQQAQGTDLKSGMDHIRCDWSSFISAR